MAFDFKGVVVGLVVVKFVISRSWDWVVAVCREPRRRMREMGR